MRNPSSSRRLPVAIRGGSTSCSASPISSREVARGAARSAPHEARAPQVERALAVVPHPRRHLVGHDLELGGDLEQVAVRVLAHQEQVVARPVPPWPPPDPYLMTR